MGAIIILLLLIMLGCEIWQNLSLTRELARQQSMLDKLHDKIDDFLYDKEDKPNE